MINYIREVNRAIGSSNTLACRYCGTEFTGIRSTEFCPNCELVVNYSGARAADMNAERSAALKSVCDAVRAGRYGDADSGFGSVIKGAEDPRYLYAYGIFLIGYSNYELTLISYTRDGFMEENARHRSTSTELYARAMMMMHRCIDAISRNKDYYSSLELRYCLILAMIKVGNRRAAHIELDGIDGMDPEGVVGGYARVVYSSYIGEYREALALLRERFSSQRFTHNDIYYLSFSLFKTGNLSSSTKLSEILAKSLGDARANILLADIGRSVALD